MIDIEFRVWVPSMNEMGTEVKTIQEIYMYEGKRVAGAEGYVFMQYTGLKDKSGNKIFEGDLIKNTRGRTCEVVWHKYSASFDTDFVSDSNSYPPEDKSFGFSPNMWGRCVEITGNIHQHPELLSK